MKLLIHDYAGHPFQTLLSRELARRGHEVTHAFADGLLTPTGNLTKTADDPDGLCFMPLQISKSYRKYKYNFVARLFMEHFYGRKISKYIKRSNFDVVISGNTPTEPQLAMQKACRKSNTKFIYWIQDFYGIAVCKLLSKKIPVIGGLLGGIYKKLDDKCLQAADGIVGITEDFLPLVEQCGGNLSNAIVVPNWSSIEQVPVLDQNNDWSRSHQLDNKFVFTYTGTLAMKHNPERLVDLAKLFLSNDDVRVLVVTEGPGAEYLEKCKKQFSLKNLILLPFQDINTMPSVLATSSALIVLLEPDAGVYSVPSKILTYLCAGRPILGSISLDNLAGKIIEEHHVGFRVDPLDREGFISKSEELFMADRDHLQKFGENSRDYAEKHFNIVEICDKFESLFLKVV